MTHKKSTPKKSTKQEAEVHEELKGFEINVDAFGNIKSNIDITEIKKFLDKNMDDKKIQNSTTEEE